MQQGHEKVVDLLLENDNRGKVRLPALHIAAKKDDVKAANLLLEVSFLKKLYLNTWLDFKKNIILELQCVNFRRFSTFTSVQKINF